jgi:hypothetical protein
MNLNTRLRRLEGTFGEPGVCPVCGGHGPQVLRFYMEWEDQSKDRHAACERCGKAGGWLIRILLLKEPPLRERGARALAVAGAAP